MNSMQWVISSLFAGIGGVFALLTYVHAGFVSSDRYTDDTHYMRQQITEINRKLDLVISRK